jgi:hypothetical protein
MNPKLKYLPQIQIYSLINFNYSFSFDYLCKFNQCLELNFLRRIKNVRSGMLRILTDYKMFSSVALKNKTIIEDKKFIKLILKIFLIIITILEL